MSYTLFYKQGACSLAVHALLNELGQEFDLKSYYAEGSKTEKNPELLAVNPRGSVPVLVDNANDFVMFEGGAILSYLCSEHDSDLLPRSGKARAKALQWLMFANSSLHPAYGKIFSLLGKYSDLGLSENVKDTLLDEARKSVQALWDQVEEHLATSGESYMCGNVLTIGDFLITNVANWSAFVPVDIELGERTKAMLKRVSTQESFAKALKTEGVSYKVA